MYEDIGIQQAHHQLNPVLPCRPSKRCAPAWMLDVWADGDEFHPAMN